MGGSAAPALTKTTPLAFRATPHAELAAVELRQEHALECSVEPTTSQVSACTLARAAVRLSRFAPRRQVELEGGR